MVSRLHGFPNCLFVIRAGFFLQYPVYSTVFSPIDSMIDIYLMLLIFQITRIFEYFIEMKNIGF